MPYISGEDRNQSILFPQSLEEYIAPDNPVHIINEYVTQLDLRKLKFTHASPKEKGRPPYHPGDMLRIYLYVVRVSQSYPLLPQAGDRGQR